MPRKKSESRRQTNALKHGAFATELLIFEEDQDEFDQLRKGLIEEFKPSGSMEEQLVLDLAKLYWRKRRAEKFYAQQANWIQMATTGAEDVEKLRMLAQYLTKGQCCKHIWDRIVPHLPDNIQIDLETKFSCPSEEYDDAWIDSLKDYMLGSARMIEEVIEDKRHTSRYMAETAIKLADLSAKHVSIEARLDALIERTLKRLAQVKAFKEVIPANNNQQAPRKISAA